MPTLTEVHVIRRLATARAQIGRCRQVCEASRKQCFTTDGEKTTLQRGFRHLFAKARTGQAALVVPVEKLPEGWRRRR